MIPVILFFVMQARVSPAQLIGSESPDVDAQAVMPEAEALPAESTIRSPESEPHAEQEAAPSARELVVQACVESHERAQLSRLEGDLSQAEQFLMKCSQAECPAVIRSDCATWRGELIAAFPTIVVRAHGDRGDIEEAQLFIDDRELGDSLNGKPFRVDPGIHFVRVLLRTGEQREQRLVLSQGEKSRLIVFDFRSEPQGQKPEQATSVSADTAVVHRPIPTSTIVLGSAALAASAFAIGFGVDALNQQSQAEEKCAPLCAASVSERVARSALIADISLGIAVAATAGTIVTYVLRPGIYLTEHEVDARAPGVIPFGTSAALDFQWGKDHAAFSWGTLF